MKPFDWKFYTSCYSDLTKKNTFHKAIQHYMKNGRYENRRTYKVIQEHNIESIHFDKIVGVQQIYISKALRSFTKRVKKKYHLEDYHDTQNPSFFFGVYTDDDLKYLLQHKGLKFIVWGGEDANPNLTHSSKTIEEVKLLHNVIHISISECIYNRLKCQNIVSILADFNLVDTDLFKPVETKGSKIFIFNGQRPGREQVYGKEIYMEVIACLPEYSYILSNTLNEPYENMPNIYSDCFIMLRLTKYDGNANSVQECEAMNIPVVHNQSKYGLKWNSTEDVINLITKYKP